MDYLVRLGKQIYLLYNHDNYITEFVPWQVQAGTNFEVYF